MSSSSSAFPEPVYEIIPEPEAEIYLTIGDFVATAGDGISFNAGKECTVVTKNPAGWWFVEMEGQEGWVPSSYLERKLSSPLSVSPLSAKPLLLVNPPAIVMPDKKALLTKKDPLKEPRRETRKDLEKKELSKEPPRPPREAKKEPQTQPKRDPKPKKELSPPEVRRMTLSSKSTSSLEGEERRPSLRRSTSTDSGLYEEVGTKQRPGNFSPPPVRSTAPPKPNRPRNTPAIPNTRSIASSKSPKDDRKLSLKASISGPMPFQPSPNTRRKAEQTTTATRTVKPISGSRLPTASHPQLKKGGSDERLNSQRGSNDVDGGRYGKKNSSPEIKLGALHETNRRNISAPRPVRHGSADSNTGRAYKLELAKKLSGKPGPSASSQPPKRPSPPNRPKAPPPGRNAPASGGSRAAQAGPPPRPHKGMTGPGKRPPPQRPSTSPANMAKKTVYVTVGGYSGGDSCLRFKDGEDVEVIEKNSDGWWFVKIGEKEGWAPSTYIEERNRPIAASVSSRPYPSRPKPPPPAGTATLPATSKKPEPAEEADPTPKPKPRPRPRKSTAAFFRASESYDIPAYEDSGMALLKGRVYELKEKSENGWWLMKDGDIEGWAPASHFKPA